MSARNATKPRILNLEHPMHQEPTSVLTTITPELASEWLGRNHGNRNQRTGAITAYARDIENDRWMVTGESIKFDWDGRLIDGQHRLEAVAATKRSIRTFVVRGLDPRVQGVLDTNAKRTAADALKFAGVEVDQKDIAAVARVAVAWKTGRIKTAIDNIAAIKLTNTEVIEWHLDNPDVEQAVAFAKRIARATGSTTAGMGAAVLFLMRIDSQSAIDFFSSAAELRTNGTGDPRKAMLDAFTKIRADRRTPGPVETLAVVFRCWNAWRAGKKLQLIRSTAGDGNGGITGVQIPEPI